MGSSVLAQADGKSFDVVICGGGLAGLTLARQLRRELPELSVALIERVGRPLPDACHKVGESSVELGSQYLERLGLRDYLHANHLLKFGLRFFPGGGHIPLEQRTELGPSNDPILPSYQLDRGRLENDLREMNEADGVVMLEASRCGRSSWPGRRGPHDHGGQRRRQGDADRGLGGRRDGAQRALA
ncbi:MAG: tryptophan 7-halogenase [Myxococcota bacterium]